MKPVLDPHRRYWDGYEPDGSSDVTGKRDDGRIEATQKIPSVGEPAVEASAGDVPVETSGDADEWDYSKPIFADPHLLDAFRERSEPLPVADEPDDPDPVGDMPAGSDETVSTPRIFPRKPMLVAAIVLAVALCTPVGVHTYRAHEHAETLTACLDAVETERTAYAKMSGLAQRHARESGYTADDLADPDLVGRLADLVEVVDIKPEYPQCDTSQSTGVLRSLADDAAREAERFTRLSKRFTRLAGKVDDSHSERLLDDAKDSLQNHIDRAKTTLSDSKDRVADNTTRTGLKTKLDQAKKTLKGADVDAMEMDVAALDKAVKAVESSIEAKRKADQTERDRLRAQQDAERSQGEVQSGSGSGSGSAPSYTQSSTPQSGSGSGSSSSGSGSVSSGSDGWSVPSQGSDPLPDTDSGL
ncbi:MULTISPECIES: FIVAR domain-containing protein [Bifidobacterium]|uniref:FIVAR domain-containing protein n=1 Tax=Bifidobacterium TaxID=1678 RepID=UPI00264767C3|nr:MULTISPECIES: FIVAR domain-containing protein [Bifidobacterium]MDN5978667.1 FIVAR domain-containing protein [Bifidobacterium mongoliense]MDN6016747.1 FIVAR domain-containing protein [Bifidobacterium mongoliense]MDN6467710.1 FIVAR domain-containing protein [Bifidobacterium crudilactis]MDN6558717.1 FIVAR domain-containing protein [Bifidobacterium crudilactis]MDN6772654.1 FIVAR domain-containing protein [Bifidobacterium crudilactis]